MTAEATAQHVLRWAAEPKGLPPKGPLWDIGRLKRPQAATLALVSGLAQAKAATLGAGAPAFGDKEPIGPGPVLLAAAVGGREQPEAARRLAEAIPPARPVSGKPSSACWQDLLARHSLISAVLAALPAASSARHDGGTDGGEDEPFTETLLRMSPLTALLYRPTLRRIKADNTGGEERAAEALIGQPCGLAVLTAGTAAWSPELDVLVWRKTLMERLRRDQPQFVLDTCTMARLRHGADWDLRLSWARRRLSLPGPPDLLALATVEFWVPLATLNKTLIGQQKTLPDTRPMLTGYRFAFELARAHRLI